MELGQLYNYSRDRNTWMLKVAAIEEVRGVGDMSIFKSVGVGLQDTAIAKAVFDKALTLGLGTEIKNYD